MKSVFHTEQNKSIAPRVGANNKKFITTNYYQARQICIPRLITERNYLLIQES